MTFLSRKLFGSKPEYLDMESPLGYFGEKQGNDGGSETHQITSGGFSFRRREGGVQSVLIVKIHFGDQVVLWLTDGCACDSRDFEFLEAGHFLHERSVDFVVMLVKGCLVIRHLVQRNEFDHESPWKIAGNENVKVRKYRGCP